MPSLESLYPSAVANPCASVVPIAAALLCWKLWAPSAQAGGKTVAVQVTHADGSEKDFTLHTDAEYLWDAMLEQDLIDGTEDKVFVPGALHNRNYFELSDIASSTTAMKLPFWSAEITRGMENGTTILSVA